jgi:cephalosporin hydroxylase
MEFIASNQNFNIDKAVERRALITSAPDGWLRRVK